MKHNLKKAQVLVMVLITMMVLAIILISVVSNSIKDTRDTRNSIIYETLYAVAEKNTIDVIHSFKDIFVKLDKESLVAHLENLGYDTSDITCEENVSKNECIMCKFKDEATQKYFANQLGDEPQSVIMNVCDSKELRSIETINGNHVFFNLIGSGKDASGNPVNLINFDVNWESVNNKSLPQFAMETILDIKFKDVSGQYQYTSLRAVYKNSSGIFSDLIENQSPNAEYIQFSSIPQGLHFTIDKNKISNILKSDTAVTSYARYLSNKTNPELEFIGARFKPLFDNGTKDSAIKISVKATDAFNSPLDNISQSRYVQTITYINDPDTQVNDIQGSQASVETGIPLYQPPGIFDYILRSDNSL
jgi:hypothetical protein